MLFSFLTRNVSLMNSHVMILILATLFMAFIISTFQRRRDKPGQTQQHECRQGLECSQHCRPDRQIPSDAGSPAQCRRRTSGHASGVVGSSGWLIHKAVLCCAGTFKMHFLFLNHLLMLSVFNLLFMSSSACLLLTRWMNG